MTNLKDKKILVTGGSRGIGAAIVKHLAQCGAKVAFTYTSRPDAAESVIQSLANPEQHLCLAMDVTKAESVEQGYQKVLEFFGGALDGLVNNAGITKDQLFLRMKEQDFDDVLNVNLKGTFLLCKQATKTMMKQKMGSIVNITSVIGQTGNPGQANYAASKAAVEAMSKSLALEFGSRQIRINCVAPGFIETEMTHILTAEQKEKILDKVPLGRMAYANEVASAVAFLLSSDASYITGHTLNVNGGLFLG